MAQIENTPSLYGIHNSNRKGDALWGKNQFNSAFPAALACWMRDQKLPAVYVSLNEKLNSVSTSTISFDEVFAPKTISKDLIFDFESSFEPYMNYLHDSLENIDLVVKRVGASGETEWLRALEVKLTVLPDETTCNLTSEGDWGSELVIRPASTSYTALGIYHSTKHKSIEARKILEPIAAKIHDWNNAAEILKHRDGILDSLSEFLQKFCDFQQPFLMQPIWKTKGKAPELDDNGFDIFLWSDFALCRVFLERALVEKKPKVVSRFLRACARLLRCLNDLMSSGKCHIEKIYRSMALGKQTDKEFSLSGKITNRYMKCARLTKPAVATSKLQEIILSGGERKLSPERRFDATIYFTAAHLFNK